jgi:microcin C transport system permease protein
MLEKIFSPVTMKRINKFKSMKRGYYSLLIISFFYFLSMFNALLINDKAIVVSHNGKLMFPFLDGIPYVNIFYPNSDLGFRPGEKQNYRLLKRRFAGEKVGADVKPVSLLTADLGLEAPAPQPNAVEEPAVKDEGWVLMPLYHFGPNESLLEELGKDEMGNDRNPPTAPDWTHPMGTDDRGRDVFARLSYGFRISISFAIIVITLSYAIGITIGAILGYFGGKIDILGQRFVEIWASMPFLYTIMIVASIREPNFLMLALLLSAFQWMGMTYYVRGEFLREKSKDYVSAAISIGATDRTIIFRHILPNALTPVISFAPFAIVGAVSSLVSLDFLGFGLPAPTPSWGELISQGLGNLPSYWLVMAPFGALFITLLLISFIGEAVREAFDPKQYSRLR